MWSQIVMNACWVHTPVTPMPIVKILMQALHVNVKLGLQEMDSENAKVKA